ncbi:MAG: hypothetical protein U5K36_05640 [Roseovarius sp.]|nr:hypothetical protein [Roseovarius sp.]
MTLTQADPMHRAQVPDRRARARAAHLWLALLLGLTCALSLESGASGVSLLALLTGQDQNEALAAIILWEPRGQHGSNWLFLDEPVASLDIGQQLVVMRLAREFASGGGGVVTVMHDLNLAAMFADVIVVMRQGRVAARGMPSDVMTSDILSQVYDCHLRVSTTPPVGIPDILPHVAGPQASGPPRDRDALLGEGWRWQPPPILCYMLLHEHR